MYEIDNNNNEMKWNLPTAISDTEKSVICDVIVILWVRIDVRIPLYASFDVLEWLISFFIRMKEKDI